jgi:hypothetical protein
MSSETVRGGLRPNLVGPDLVNAVMQVGLIGFTVLGFLLTASRHRVWTRGKLDFPDFLVVQCLQGMARSKSGWNFYDYNYHCVGANLWYCELLALRTASL